MLVPLWYGMGFFVLWRNYIMANTDNPRGFRVWGETRHIGHYKKDASAGAIFKGTVVMMEDDGYIAPYTPGSGYKVLGVSADYSAASTADTDVAVYDDPHQYFIFQEDSDGAAMAQTNVGNNVDTTSESGSTTTELSTMELDSSGAATTATLPFRIEQIANTYYSDGTANAAGNYCEWIVTPNLHYHNNTTGI